MNRAAELRFPEGFLWGAATAAFQVEGGNVASDVWLLEHLPNTIFQEPSGDACDFYHRYADDVATVASLGLNTFRFGVEWARIEPERGLVSTAALDHYSRVVDCCIDHGLTPVVTLHHFTSPRWLVRAGGWRSGDTPGLFAEYAGRLARLRSRRGRAPGFGRAPPPLSVEPARRPSSATPPSHAGVRRAMKLQWTSKLLLFGSCARRRPSLARRSRGTTHDRSRPGRNPGPPGGRRTIRVNSSTRTTPPNAK